MSSVRPRQRASLVLFVAYCLLYAGFMTLAALRPDLMGAMVPGIGLNVAIVYGVGLIAAALVVALLSMLVPARR